MGHVLMVERGAPARPAPPSQRVASEASLPVPAHMAEGHKRLACVRHRLEEGRLGVQRPGVRIAPPPSHPNGLERDRR
jgi:hypothetical protein